MINHIENSLIRRYDLSKFEQVFVARQRQTIASITELLFMKPYAKRFAAVIRHIHQHLDDALTLAELSEVAHFSMFHFHRQFSAFIGMSVAKYVLAQRLKRAAYQLAFRAHSVLDIALQAGFASPEAFHHAFVKAYGQSPSSFRRQPNANFFVANPTLPGVLTMNDNVDNVQIVELPDIFLAVLEHRGPPAELAHSIRQFIAWRKQKGLHPSQYATFNLLYDDPNVIPVDQFRLDLAVQLPRPFAAEDGLAAKVIPKGRYAKWRFVGPDAKLAECFDFLYGKWLPHSGEELVDFPCFLQRINIFPDVKDIDATVDIYLPLKG